MTVQSQAERGLEDATGKVVLVTGAAGFIGSHVARYCAEELGMAVVAVDDLSGGYLSNVPEIDSVAFVRGDIKDAVFLGELFGRFSFDFVYHLAAYPAIGISHFIRSYNYRNNFVASTEIINAIMKSHHKVDCFIFTSSNGKLQLEETVPQPEDPYGISKYSTELDIKAAHKTWGLDSVILRLHNVYGPNQNMKDIYRNAIAIFMHEVMSGDLITIFEDDTQTRQFTYITDVTPIIAKAPLIRAARNQVINVGSDKSYSINELAHYILTLMGEDKTRIKHVEARQEVQHASVKDHSKLRSLFGPSTPVELKEGLRLLVESLKQKDIAKNSATMIDSVEVLDQMPPIWVTPDLTQKEKVELQGPPINETYKERSK